MKTYRWGPVFLVLLLGVVVLHIKNVFRPQVCFGSRCLRVEVARTQAQRAKGLMFRSSLKQGRGMLFVFPRDDYWGFWMKNTHIPLDIIWLDKDKKVVYKVENAQPSTADPPPTFRPVLPAAYAVEANAGFVNKNNVTFKDTAVFKWIS
jgi:uncharacterized membrane protein (UPF0127 family)